MHVVAEHQQLEDWNNYYSDTNRKYLAYMTSAMASISAALQACAFMLFGSKSNSYIACFTDYRPTEHTKTDLINIVQFHA